jgi:hypothetical protein
VDLLLPLVPPNVETTKLLHAKEDAHHLHHHLHHLQIHVIAKLLQSENVEVPQHLDQLHVEITKLQHVKEDVIQKHPTKSM